MTEMRLRPATPAELRDWDALVLTNPDGGQFTQTLAFAELKRWDGFRTHHLVFEAEVPVYALALERNGWIGRFWYFPCAPLHPDMRAVVDAIRAFVRREHPNLISVKVEPRLPRTPEALAMLADAGLTQAEDVQLHTHTVVIDLERTEEEIFGSFSKTARKLIRRAERDGFTIERVEGDEALFDLAWERMQTIRGGKGLAGMRDEDYYKTIWRAFTSRGQADWWLGHDGGDGPQTVTFTIPFGRTVIDKDEGSRPDRLIEGGAHLGRWTRVRHYRERGFSGLDMMGAPPTWAKDDPDHWMAGLARFKQQFGEISDFAPSHDVLLRPRAQQVWRKAVRPVEWRVKRRYTGLW
ncbi:serine/alanine adding enzyme [Agrococcus sp. UYP33]